MSKHTLPEAFYCKKIATYFKGVEQVHLKSGLIPDVVTDVLVIEVDFVHKWAESIGQSLQYSLETGKKATIVFIYDSVRDYYLLNEVTPLLKRLSISVYVIDINSYVITTICLF
jgi:hypothetical protein